MNDLEWLLEQAYKTAWGPKGSSDLRDKWRVVYNRLQTQRLIRTLFCDEFGCTWN